MFYSTYYNNHCVSGSMFTAPSRCELEECWRGTQPVGLLWSMYVDVCLLQQESLWDLGTQPCRDAVISPDGEAVPVTV